MSGEEQKFIKEAFDTNWVVPLGPNVNVKQPRDYMTTFMFIGMIAGAVIGLLVAHPTMNLPVLDVYKRQT